MLTLDTDTRHLHYIHLNFTLTLGTYTRHLHHTLTLYTYTTHLHYTLTLCANTYTSAYAVRTEIQMQYANANTYTYA